ncbi:hypothetical protein G9A89_021169 [Geosiphon pyriformis]|nr:hypothetical protein G9A89_021169 [Geosiphon pyriformis]
MDGSLSGLKTVAMKAGAVVFFEDIDLGLSVGIFGLVSSTLMELQAIALAFECVPLFHLVDLFSDSQATLDACRSESLLIKSHSGISGNEHANALAKNAVLSVWHLPYLVSEHFLSTGDIVVSDNSKHFIHNVFHFVYYARWEIGSGSQVVVNSLRVDINWFKFSLVWHPDFYLVAVVVRKRLYDKGYPSVVCLYCGNIEVLNHIFSCPHNTADCVQLLNTYASTWEALSDSKDDIWLVYVKHQAFMEKHGLIPYDSSILTSISGLSMVFLAGIVRLLGVAEAFGVGFGFCTSSQNFFWFLMEPAKAKLFLSHSSVTTPKSRHEKDILDHPFNHYVGVFLPNLTAKKVEQWCNFKPFYYQAELPLTHFIDKAFLQQYVKAGKVYAHSFSEGIDISNTFALDGAGKLVLNLTKDAYETFGLDGKPAKFGPHRQRYIIEIDLRSSSMVPGKKGYERIKWCFEHNLSGTYPFMISFVDSASGEIREISFPAEYNVQKIVIEPDILDTDNPLTPDITSIKQISNQEEWTSKALDIYEWIGMLHQKAQRPPYPSSPTSGTLLRWTGMIVPELIVELLKFLHRSLIDKDNLLWGNISVGGIEDSVVSWRGHQRGFFTSGENCYTFLLWADGTYVLFQSLSTYETFS